MLDLRRRYEAQIAGLQQERQRQLSNVYYNTEHESVQNWDFKINGVRREISWIDDELAARRNERAG
jgi:hypothetical protein